MCEICIGGFQESGMPQLPASFAENAESYLRGFQEGVALSRMEVSLLLYCLRSCKSWIREFTHPEAQAMYQRSGRSQQFSNSFLVSSILFDDALDMPTELTTIQVVCLHSFAFGTDIVSAQVRETSQSLQRHGGMKLRCI